MSQLRDTMIALLDAARDWPHDPETSDYQSGRREHTMAYTNASERRLAKAIDAADRALHMDLSCMATVNDEPCILSFGHKGNHRL